MVTGIIKSGGKTFHKRITVGPDGKQIIEDIEQTTQQPEAADPNLQKQLQEMQKQINELRKQLPAKSNK